MIQGLVLYPWYDSRSSAPLLLDGRVLIGRLFVLLPSDVQWSDVPVLLPGSLLGTMSDPCQASSCDDFEGFRSEWYISIIYHARDTPFWSGTLDFNPVLVS